MPVDTLEKDVKKITIQFTPEAYEELERLRTTIGADNYRQLMLFCYTVGRTVIEEERKGYELVFIPTLKKRWDAFKKGLNTLCDVFTSEVKVKAPTKEIIQEYRGRDSRGLEEITVQFTPGAYEELERVRTAIGADNYQQLMRYFFTIGRMVVYKQNEGFESVFIPGANSKSPDLQYVIPPCNEIMMHIKMKSDVTQVEPLKPRSR